MKGLAKRIGRHLQSPSTRTAALVGLLCYLSYAYGHGGWANPALIGVSLLTAAFLPGCARFAKWAELWADNRFGFVTAGRLGEFVPQYALTLAAFWVMEQGGALDVAGVASVGGVAVASLVATLASQGSQHVGLFLSQRGIGDAKRNVVIGVSVALMLTALGTAGVPVARETFLILGPLLGAILLGGGLLSDLRSVAAPKGGIGLFFGTFNPFHVTHLEIVRRAIAERRLDRVVIHPTLIPRLHADAFRNGQLRVARLEKGFQAYETTDRADVNVDYFPSGRTFLPPETRKVLIELAIDEAGLSDRVEVAFHREIYDSQGFTGVIAEVARQHPGVRLHGLHGTDIGGMEVRRIYDEAGWIYPWRLLRRDAVSATAIRRGVPGMTASVVADALAQIAADLPVVTAGGRRFRNDNGVLIEERQA